jgi:hypothetical protein
MDIREGQLAFIPSELAWGVAEMTEEYDPYANETYQFVTLVPETGPTRSIPVHRIDATGLRGPLPLAAVQMMLAIIASRIGPLKGGRFELRNAHVYKNLLEDNKDFGPAMVLRDIAERSRRSDKAMKRKRWTLRDAAGRPRLPRNTPEEAYAGMLANYIAAEYAGAMHRRHGGRYQMFLQEGLEKVLAAMSLGSPFSIAVY